MSRTNNLDVPASLPPLLDEFRIALLDEIEVAKRNASNSSIPLSNGHKIGQQGSAFQYAFLIDTVLNTPDGAPCDFIIPGRAPMQVTIVSTEGLRIIISVENDLGQFVPTARLQTNLSILMRKLIERIESNTSANNAAASRMLGITTVAGNPKKPLGETSLNPDQLSALESAIGRNFTVIWGPPGTGKTFTIGTITEQLYKLARTVLIVSHTNTAVDQAIKHVADSLKEYIEQGAVIRIGDVRDQELKSHYPDVLLKRQVERQSQELVEHKDALTLKKQLFLEELNIINKNISILDWLEAADLDIQSSKENIQKFHRLETQFRSDEKALAELEIEQPRLVELHKITSRVLELRQAIANKKEQRDHLKEQLSNFKNKIGEAKLNAQKQQSRLEIADRIAPLKIERAKYPSIQEQKAIIGTLYSKILELKKASEDMQQRYNTAYDILSQLSNISNFRRILKRLPKPEEQKNVIDELFRSLTVLETESNATSTAHNNTVNKLSRILELDAELSRYDDIGSGSEELKKLINIQNELRNLEETGSGFDTNIGRLYAEMMELEECERTEAASINGDVHAMDQEICSKLENIEKLKNVITPIHLNIKKLRKIVNFTLNGLLTQVSEWLSIGEKPVSEDDKFDLVRDCCKKLMEQQETSDLQSLKKKGRFYSLRNS